MTDVTVEVVEDTVIVQTEEVIMQVLEVVHGGPMGPRGEVGESAYEAAVENGFVGTEAAWLASLVGADGTNGTNGTDGDSAYEVAVANGFVGDEAAWLASLAGADGTNGTNGTDGEDGWTPTTANVADGARIVQQVTGWTGGTGTPPSSTNVFVGPTGFVGTAAAATDIRGATGADGDDGTDGATGPAGANGTGGLPYRFSTSLINAGGSGHFAFNNTPDNATSFRISTLDDATNNQTAFLSILDQGTSVHKTAIQIQKADASAGVLFYIDGPVDTSQVNYYIYPITLLGTWGTFTNNDPFSLHWTKVGDKGTTGDAGLDGTDGADGAAAGMAFVYRSSTAASDPGGPGNFRLDNVDHTAVTKIYIDQNNAANQPMTNWVLALDDGSGTTKSVLSIKRQDDAVGWTYKVTGAITDHGGWYEIPVTFVNLWGSPSDGQASYITWSPTGDAGPAGAAGTNGTNGTNGAAGADGVNGGNKYTFSSGTSGDPTSGKFLFNHATFLSATQMNISETDADGAALASYLAAADDVSTSTNRAIVRFKNALGTKGFSLYISGAITDAGTYDTFPITPIGSWGSPANNDVMYMTWEPSGAKGDTGAAGASSGGSGIVVASFIFDNVTSDANPGTGKFRNSRASNFGSGVDTGTLYINVTDNNAQDLTSLLASMSVPYMLTTVIEVYDTASITALGRRQMFKVTSVTAGAGYYKIGYKTLFVSNNMVNGNTCTIIFHPKTRHVDLPSGSFGQANADGRVGLPEFLSFKQAPFSVARRTSYATPFVVRSNIQVNSMGVVVSQAGTAGTDNGHIRCMVYNARQESASGFYMTSPAIDGGKQLNALSSTGRKIVSPGVELTPGYYVLIVAIDEVVGTPQIKALHGQWQGSEFFQETFSTSYTIAQYMNVSGPSLYDPVTLVDQDTYLAAVTQALPDTTDSLNYFKSLAFMGWRPLGFGD